LQQRPKLQGFFSPEPFGVVVKGEADAAVARKAGVLAPGHPAGGL